MKLLAAIGCLLMTIFGITGAIALINCNAWSIWAHSLSVWLAVPGMILLMLLICSWFIIAAALLIYSTE